MRALKVIGAFLKWKARSIKRLRPLWVALYVTRKCNLNCCYCDLGGKNRPDPSKKEVFGFLGKIKELGIPMVVVTGGEPTLRSDLIDIVSYCNSAGFITCLNTNGTLLDARYIDSLGQSGLDILNISVDNLRGNGDSLKSIHAMRDTLELLSLTRSKYKLTVICSQVLSSANIAEIEPLLEQLKIIDLPAAPNIRFPVDSCFSSKEDLNRLSKCISIILARRNDGYAIALSREFLRFAVRFLEGAKQWDCCAGEGFFSVDVDGSVSICDRLEMSEFRSMGLSINDLRIDKLQELALNARTVRELRNCNQYCLANCAFESGCFIKRPWRYMVDVRQRGYI